METALVTGGNSGIGYEVVRQLAERGMTVYLGSRNAANGDRAAGELASAGDVRPIDLDLLDDGSLRAAVDRIAREQGKLDLLVNSAGIALPGDTPETLEIVFRTNLFGPMRLSQMCVPLLRASSAGRIVMVSSGAGQFSFLAGDFLSLNPESLPYAYPVSKTALNGATVMLATALRKDGISVNACSPGLVATKLSGMPGKSPAEAAAIVVSLAEPRVDGATGGFFDADGAIDW